MINIPTIGRAAQPPLTANAVAYFGDAIRNAPDALLNGPLDIAVVHLEDARRLAAEVNNPHAHELANLVGALEQAFEMLTLADGTRDAAQMVEGQKRIQISSARKAVPDAEEPPESDAPPPTGDDTARSFEDLEDASMIPTERPRNQSENKTGGPKARLS